MIYKGKPTKEWMNTFERGHRQTWLILLVSFLSVIILALFAMWGGLVWFGKTGFNGQGISVQVEGPQEISIGSEVTYFINWFNTAHEPLATTEFRVSFPSDFVVTNVVPQPTAAGSADQAPASNSPQSMTFRLGAQEIEAHGAIKVTGRFTGALGTKSAVQVIAMYRPASFNSDFEALVTKDVAYTTSVLSGVITAPVKVIPGDALTVSYRVTNDGTDSMSGIVAKVTLPDGFIPASSTLAVAENGEVSVPIGTLAGGTSSTVSIRGAFSLSAHGDRKIHAEAGVLTADGAFASAQTSDASVSVLAGDLKVDLVINGSQNDRSANPGDMQRISIGYMNTSDEVLKNVVLTLRFAGVQASSTQEIALADWTQLTDPQTGTRVGNTVSYTKDQVKEFEELAPNAAGTIELSVPLRSQIAPMDDVPLNASVEARVASVGDTKVNRTVKTTPIVIRLRSDALIDAAARYSNDEGIRLGSGPLPPTVGTSTTYRIEWHLTKSLHELSRVIVSATLPDGVNFGSVKEVGAGDVGFDVDKKLVTWQINRMPESVGDLLSSFDVSISPSEADVGRFANLLGETRLEFVDSTLNESVLRTSPALTTELPDDTLAKKKGVIQDR